MKTLQTAVVEVKLCPGSLDEPVTSGLAASGRDTGRQTGQTAACRLSLPVLSRRQGCCPIMASP